MDHDSPGLPRNPSDSASERRTSPLFPADSPLFVPFTLALVLGDALSAVLLNRLHHWQQRHLEVGHNVDEHGVAWVEFPKFRWLSDLQISNRATLDRRLGTLRAAGILLRNGRSGYAISHERLLEVADKALGCEAGRSAESLLDPSRGGQVRLLYPRLVQAGLSVTQALLVSQLYFHLNGNGQLVAGGVVRSIRQWQEEDFPFLKGDTINENFSRLVELGFIVREKSHSAFFDHTYVYTLNTERLAKLEAPEVRATDHAWGLTRPGTKAASLEGGAVQVQQKRPAGTQETGALPQSPAGVPQKPRILYGNRLEIPQNRIEGESRPARPGATRASLQGQGQSVQSDFQEHRESAGVPGGAVQDAAGGRARSAEPRLDPLVRRRIRQGTLQELFEERPERAVKWAALSREQVRGADQAARNAKKGSHLSLTTLFKDELDATGGVNGRGEATGGQHVSGEVAPAVVLRQQAALQFGNKVADEMDCPLGIDAVAKHARERFLADHTVEDFHDVHDVGRVIEAYLERRGGLVAVAAEHLAATRVAGEVSSGASAGRPPGRASTDGTGFRSPARSTRGAGLPASLARGSWPRPDSLN